MTAVMFLLIAMIHVAVNLIHAQPENGNSDIYWIDAAVIERLRPAAADGR